MKRNIAQTKRDAVSFKDMPCRDAERRPRKLNEREHGVYMPEAEGNFNIGEKPEMNPHSNQPSCVYQDDCVKVEEARED
jgi:hypothetical protein